MDKISSIIPGNKRVTTVDLKASGSGRSGTPGFGREVNITGDRLHSHAETAKAAMERQNDMMALRQPSKEAHKVDIVTKMTDKFFSQKARENELPEIKPEEKFNVEDLQIATPVIAGTAASAPGKGGLHQMSEAETAATTSAEEETPTVGGQLDVRA